MTEHDKREVAHQFEVIRGFIDEQFDDLTVRQLRELAAKAQEIWTILERRGCERRHV